MAVINKPASLSKVWASSGDRSAPPDSKISQGWQVEVPPRQWFNWLDNRQDQAIAHFNQHGIPVWDAETEYQDNKSYVQDPLSGDIYRSRVTNVGRMPSVSPQYWERFTGGGQVGPGESYDRTTSRLTTVSTSWVTEEFTYKTTSAITSYTTSWSYSGTVYTISNIENLTWHPGWQVGDTATVTGGTVAPGYNRRALRITQVDGSGIPTSWTVINEGGYTNSTFSSGGFSGRSSGTWSGGTTRVVGTYSGTTSKNTSRTTSWSTVAGVSSKTTGVVTTFPTSWTTVVETPPNIANILVIGQSTIANYGDPAFEYSPLPSVERLEMTGLGMESAISPATGNPLATGNGGNMDGLIGDGLINEAGFARVRIFNAAVGGTSILWWTSDAPTDAYDVRPDDLFPYTQGRLFERLQYVKNATTSMNISISHILIHIGETDAQLGTTREDYVAAFKKLKDDLRNLGFNAPILLGRVSYLYGQTSSDIIAAQDQIIAENSDVFAGPNTDVYGASYRLSDNLHWNSAGLQAVASEWVSRISSELGGL